ncbi:hypothetical protein BSIN_0133 [Burkholderia singularis]|uniref:Ferritin-like diiron domain-containing protein n=1 Tax=Burkholderia singularis TaxID=1503053 RepID=A0A238H2V1_9BURK|nr:hypothetical protein BSIN_0133 [Burkholderia singularis]
MFRSTAEGETSHARRYLEYLETVGDPATDLLFGALRLRHDGACDVSPRRQSGGTMRLVT